MKEKVKMGKPEEILNFDEERENTKLRLENSKLQIELLQEKVKRLENQNIPLNTPESIKEPQIIKEEKAKENTVVIDSNIDKTKQEASLVAQIPISASKEVPVLKKAKFNPNKYSIILPILKIITTIALFIGAGAGAYLFLWKYIGLSNPYSIPISVGFSCVVTISFYLIFFIQKGKQKINSLDNISQYLVYCPYCNSKLTKGKLKEDEKNFSQIYKCKNNECLFQKEVTYGR